MPHPTDKLSPIMPPRTSLPSAEQLAELRDIRERLADARYRMVHARSAAEKREREELYGALRELVAAELRLAKIVERLAR